MNSQHLYDKIPIELYFIIKSYVTSRDYWQWMNSSSFSYFQEIKWATISLKFTLSSSSSSLKLEDNNQIIEIIKKLKNPHEQISLICLDKKMSLHEVLTHKISLFLTTTRISKLDLRQVDSSSLNNLSLEDLSLTNLLFQVKNEIYLEKLNQITTFPRDITNQIKVESIHLAECLNLTSNLQGLAHLQSISISKCNAIIELSCLSKLQKLSVIDCRNLKTVEGLGQIPILCLSSCPAIVDISPLTHNISLTIMKCIGITMGLPSLQRVRSLTTDLIQSSQQTARTNLQNCQLLLLLNFQANEEEFSLSLPQLKQLTFQESELFTTGSFLFQHLYSLKLVKTRIQSPQLLESFGKIPLIEISNNPELEDLSFLKNGKQKLIIIQNCPRIKDFSPINYKERVIIKECSGFYNGEDLNNVKDLEIHSCHLSDVSKFRNCHSLGLYHMSNILTLDGLEKIPILKLDFSLKNSLYMYSWMKYRYVGNLLVPLSTIQRNEKIICNKEYEFSLVLKQHYRLLGNIQSNNGLNLLNVYLRKDLP